MRFPVPGKQVDRRAGLGLLIAAVVLAAIVLGAAVYGLVRAIGGSGDRALHLSVPGPHGLAAIGPGVAAALFDNGALVRVGANGQIVYRVAVGRHPTNPALTGAHLWVPVVGDGQLVELDAQSGRIVRRVAGVYAAAVAGPSGALLLPSWPAAPRDPKLWRGNAVTRLDSSTGRVVWRRSFAGIVLTLAYRAGRVWAPDFAGRTVRVLDAADGSTISAVGLPGRPVAIAAGDRCTWVALASGSLLRLDPRTFRIEGTTSLHNDNVDYMVADSSGVWLTRYASPSTAVLEHVLCRDGRIDDSRQVGGASQGLAVGGGSLWLADYGNGRLVRLQEPR